MSDLFSLRSWMVATPSKSLELTGPAVCIVIGISALCSFVVSVLKIQHFIGNTCPCNEYPLKPRLCITKQEYARVFLFFLLCPKTDCGYSLEPPRRGGYNVYPQSMF